MRKYSTKEVADILMVSKDRVKNLIARKALIPDMTEERGGGRVRYYFSEKVIREYAEEAGVFYDFSRADNSVEKKHQYSKCGLWIITIDRGYLDRNHYLKHHAFAVTNSIKYTYMFDSYEEPKKIVDAYGIGRVETLYMEV